jgi:hypothetical protein
MTDVSVSERGWTASNIAGSLPFFLNHIAFESTRSPTLAPASLQLSLRRSSKSTRAATVVACSLPSVS